MVGDARVLRDEFVPREVAHRDAEVNQLSRILDPVTRDEPAETTILTGPSGTGKTCIARFTVDRLRQERLDIEAVYVNCWQNYSRFRVAYAILEALGRTVDVHRQSTPHDELLDRLHSYDGSPVVVVLDEIDQLEDHDLPYDLHGLSRFTTILIANREEDLFGQVEERLTSRLIGSERIRFERYGLGGLVGILGARAHGDSPTARSGAPSSGRSQTRRQAMRASVSAFSGARPGTPRNTQSTGSRTRS